MVDETKSENGAPEKPELSLDFDFTPTWARKPPENPYLGRAERAPGREDRPGRGGERRGGFDRRGPRPEGGFRRPGGPGSMDRRPRPGGERGARPGRGDDRRDRRREDGGRRPGPPRESLPRLNVQVSFLPDRERLALVVRDIQASRRAFPLIEIASRFLSREDLYLVKLELPPPAEGQPRQTLVQCLECKRVFRVRANAEAHVLNDHLDKHFTVEETEVEPPAGNFACVARCGLSHVLLGPPNYHGYNEKIQELWASRFAHMSKAEYLGHIETVRDETLVAQWKDSLRKQTVYRLKEAPEGQEVKALTKAEAQDWMRTGKVNPLLRESGRCLLPGTLAKKFDDPALRTSVSLALQKENRFPFTLSLALRPAFRHMRLHLFKQNARETYVTAVLPKPVDLATAPAIVKEIVAFLEAHAGAMRQQVLDGLRPGVDPESPEAAELLLHLNNLVATGGVIELFNATLVLPKPAMRPEAKPSGRPETAETAAEAVPAAESAGEPATAEDLAEALAEAPAEAPAGETPAAEDPPACEQPAEEIPTEPAAAAADAPVAAEEAPKAE